MSKKGDGHLFWILAMAFVAIAAGIIILLFSGKAFGKSFTSTDNLLGELDDYDNDKIANFYDYCPCTPIGTTESADLQGCPQGKTGQQSQEEKKSLKEGKCALIDSGAEQLEITITSLKLFDGETEVSSPYTTSHNLIHYEATCASQCSLEFRFEEFEQPEIVQFDAGGFSDSFNLPDPGTYFIILKENNQEKIQFRIEKE